MRETRKKEPRLLDQVRRAARVRHMSIRTEKSYVSWIKRFIVFHGLRHPGELDARDVTSFLTHLAVDRTVGASTQNQALSAILFLYREVLDLQLAQLGDIVRARRKTKIPVVLTKEEVQAVLVRIDGGPGRIARLLYGTGMRVTECLRLRVKDVDLGRRTSRCTTQKVATRESLCSRSRWRTNSNGRSRR